MGCYGGSRSSGCDGLRNLCCGESGRCPWTPHCWRRGGRGQDERPGPCWLVPEGEEHNGREDQSAELSGQRVTKVYRDGGKQARAESHNRDCHQNAKGRDCFDFEVEFHRQARGVMIVVSRADPF